MAKTAEPISKLDGATVKTFLHRIDELFAEMASEQGSYMARCKGIRDDMKEVYADAKNQSVPTRELKKLVAIRRKMAKLYAELQELDTLEQNTLAELMRLTETKQELPLLEWIEKASVEPVATLIPAKGKATEALVN